MRDRYIAQCALGHGAYGEVFKAVVRSTGEIVAVKHLKLREAKKANAKTGDVKKNEAEKKKIEINGSLIQCSIRELSFLGSLRHPNVLALLLRFGQSLPGVRARRR